LKQHVVRSYKKKSGVRVHSHIKGNSYGSTYGSAREKNPLYLDHPHPKRIGGSKPMPGDVIKPINSGDSLIKSTSYGIIEGALGRAKSTYSVCFNPSPAPWWDSGFVTSSGGPTRSIKASSMKPAGWKNQSFHYFPRGFAGAGLAKYKTVKVKVWKVDGSRW